MSDTAHIIRQTILLVVFGAFVCWLMIRAYRRSTERGWLLVKWFFTALIVAYLLLKVVPMTSQVGYSMIGAVVLTWFCGWGLAIIWRRNLASLVAKPFASLYDGGDREPEPHPVYSIAQAKRKRGHYTEAIAEIRKQLALFTSDFEGQMMIAEIEAENLNDLPGAELTIQRLFGQPGHSPRNLAFALNSLADWHLKFAQDRDAAKQDLEKIVELFPGSELAMLATQRIAHLAETSQLLAPYDRKRIAVAPGVPDLGLLAGEQQPKAPEIDPATLASQYVKHLQDHPLDAEAREKLAVLYADHYGRLDLAADQLEQLIAHPNQPARQVVHCLNLLADLQIRHSAGYETIRQTLQRIIDLYPNAASAQLTRNRLDLLKLELKGKQNAQAVKLGEYEQDIGLKRGPLDR
jgi:tetratricopeptide (TPR) repeat protein